MAILLLSTNLRPAAVSVGPVLDELRDGLDMGPASAGLLTSLPVLAFAIFGALAPAAARRLGPHRVTFLALLARRGRPGRRAVVQQETAFLVLSLLAHRGDGDGERADPLPGPAALPGPDRAGDRALHDRPGRRADRVVPPHGAGRRRVRGLALRHRDLGVLAAVAAVPWFGLVRRDEALDAPVRDVSFGDIARTRLGWAMTLFFGLQSLMAYAVFGWFATLWRDAGFGAGTASALVGIVAAMSIPLSLSASPGRGPAR